MNILQVKIPTTEVQFVEEIHGSGVLVYVSATWLCELYQNVLAKSLLLSAGYDPKSRQQPAIINLLTGNYYFFLRQSVFKKLCLFSNVQFHTNLSAIRDIFFSIELRFCKGLGTNFYNRPF